MKWNTVDELKVVVRKEGFLHKAILSDEDDTKVDKLLRAHPDVVDTPPAELRYMEGLLNLPYGFIDEFKAIPAPEYKQCNCGRTPTALDIVSYACRRSVHSKSLIRDTVTGYENIFEISESGREADCLKCGRRVVMLGYFGKGYKYA